MSNEFPLMLYKAGGASDVHGGKFDWLIVADEEEMNAAFAEGWHKSTTEAKEAVSAPAKTESKDDNAPPTRAELEAKASELGLKFDGRTGDKKLGEMIAEALAK